jgi:predicted nucleic acid-binding protein
LPEIVCDTSPLQYLHQLGLLNLLPDLIRQVTIPSAVADELDAGKTLGLNLPDVKSLNWITVISPKSGDLPITVTGLGQGEMEVLLLALEFNAKAKGAIAIIDDARARDVAERLGIKLTGTLGILLDAKRLGLVSEVAPLIERLQTLGFRLASQTREAILKLAGEMP